MNRPPFDPKELEQIGSYPAANPRQPEQPKYNKIISPRENWKLIFSGQKPMYMPQSGWGNCDVHPFRPRIQRDNVVTHLVFDGEAPIEYETNTMRSWFDLDWVFVPTVGGATVMPGSPKVKDITKWEEYVTLPNLDELDWERSAEANKQYLDTDKMIQVGMLSGLWERLISLCDVDNAAVALIDDDEKPGVHRLFSYLCDLYDDIIGRYQKYYHIDCVLMHDDWGSQRAPFFSTQTAREMLQPYLTRIVQSCHKRGLSFEHHSCGMIEPLMPVMIDSGVDLWCGQPMNDYDKLAHMYKDTCIVIGVPGPVLPPDATLEETREAAKEFVEHFADCRIALGAGMYSPDFIKAVYEFSRKAYMQ